MLLHQKSIISDSSQAGRSPTQNDKTNFDAETYIFLHIFAKI
jgi:hypothetical protein